MFKPAKDGYVTLKLLSGSCPRSFGGGIAKPHQDLWSDIHSKKSPSGWFNLQWSPCGKALFFAGKSPTCLVHHRSVSVKHPSRTSTLLDVFIMCVLMNIAFCSSNISCAGPHQQTLFVGPKYVCSARTINRDILFPYHHIISLPKKTSTNIEHCSLSRKKVCQSGPPQSSLTPFPWCLPINIHRSHAINRDTCCDVVHLRQYSAFHLRGLGRCRLTLRSSRVFLKCRSCFVTHDL